MGDKGYIKQLIQKFLIEGNKIAFCLYDGEIIKDISYEDFVKDILKVAEHFRKNKISKKHIAIIETNSYQWVVTLFAIFVTGNIAVLLDPLLPEDLLLEKCKLAEVSIIYSNEKLFNSLKKGNMILDNEIFSGESLATIDDLYEENEEDTLILLATSGTTGSSKIVEITSMNIKYSMEGWEDAFSRDGKERILAAFPFHHIGGIIAVFTNLYWSKVTCMGRGLRNIFADIPILNPTHVTMVPAMLESLEKILKNLKSTDERRKYLGNNLRRINVAGASLKEATCKFFLKQDIILEIGYGMTETTGGIMWCELNENCIGTIGKTIAGMQSDIVDGELVAKGPLVMKGYFKDPDETKLTVKDGWMYTGDMGYCDENGYYYLTGRKKNVIILSNGENVNPEEIENYFHGCEDVIEVMVYSDGKGICADIFAENTEKVIEYIKKYNSNMPLYRQVYKVNYKEVPLEKTSAGKIKRKGNVYAK